MLGDYQGKSSSPQLFPHLVGEKIVGVFEIECQIFFVFESGHALKVASDADRSGPPLYSVVDPKFTGEMCRLKYDALIPKVAEFASLPKQFVPRTKE